MAKSIKSEAVEKFTQVEIDKIEKSAEIASDFIHDELIPLLENFESDNDYKDYIQGIATHGLFVELVQRMGELGYTEKDLRKEIKIYLNSSIGQIIH